MTIRNWTGHTEATPSGDPGLAANYSGNTLPTTADTANWGGGSQSLNTNLAALAGVALALATFAKTFTGNVGNSANRFGLQATTVEYNGRGQEAWLELQATTTKVRGTGSGFLNLKSAAAQSIGNLEARDGIIYIADGSTVGNIKVKHATVYIGVGCTVGSVVRVDGGRGKVFTKSSLTTLSGSNGYVETDGDETLTIAITTVNLDGVKLKHQSSGTLGTVNNNKVDQLNLITQDSPNGFTITTYNVNEDALDDIPPGDTKVVITNPINKIFNEV